MLSTETSFNSIVLRHWEKFRQNLDAIAEPGLIDGQSLDVALVVAVVRYGKLVQIEPKTREAISDSAEALREGLSRGEVVYGINTGFGGSVDVRTQVIIEVQRELIRGLHYGIIDSSEAPCKTRHVLPDSQHTLCHVYQHALPLNHPVADTCMPESWTRASMLIRLNSLANGASGVRSSVVGTLVRLLNEDIVPLVPLRGSVSASGDLSPLSYIAGLMQGKPALSAYAGSRSKPRRVIRANQALKEAGIRPIDIAPKEGLALVNGTATSTALAALALHEAFCLATLSQVLTAMSVEALCGTIESFHPFFAQVRPHPGQAESAQNILAFANQSKFLLENDGTKESTLRQDRYAIRTAAQWIGPVLEDLILSYDQTTIELNSVTDNPLIDTQGKMLHGGSFQARSVTSAMEKTRQACETIGQMLFTQCTELINPATNRGLPRNLVVDEPSESWLWKGTDILIAALQSELGFLANPVGSHVKPAEMGNQALNSLALISGPYTLSAIDVLSQLSAAHLVALSQALDLRAMHSHFLSAVAHDFQQITRQVLGPVLLPGQNVDVLQSTLWERFVDHLQRTTSKDSVPRIASGIGSLHSLVLSSTTESRETLQALQSWTFKCTQSAISHFRTTKANYLADPDATSFLGMASSRMYKFIREDLAIPFFGEEFIRGAEWETPELESEENTGSLDPKKVGYQSMGDMITAVYKGIRSGALFDVVIECLKDSTGTEAASG